MKAVFLSFKLVTKLIQNSFQTNNLFNAVRLRLVWMLARPHMNYLLKMKRAYKDPASNCSSIGYAVLNLLLPETH